MTTTRKLRKHYDKFTVTERVNLVLAAQERGDEAEVHALENYCPMTASLNYEGRILSLTQAASTLAVQLLARDVLVVKRLESLANTRENAGQADANPPLNDPDIAPATAIDDKLALLLDQAAAIWFGFSAWCRDVGHDPHQVVRLAPMGPDDSDPAFFLIHQQIELFERWAQHLPHGLDKAEMWRQLFTQAFQSVIA
ncbi:MAG: hypothetical protein KAX24_03565 [Anaerolineae bacterium]|nr:hypothetical protein [Anaerolineae bacterium]